MSSIYKAIKSEICTIQMILPCILFCKGLSNLVKAVDKHSGKKCLNLNANKTKVMKTDKEKEDLEIKVNGETLELFLICIFGIYNIWRWRWDGGNKEETCYGNAQTNRNEILVHVSRC